MRSRFKVDHCFLPYLRVHPDVWLHQAFLFELYRAMHFFQTYPLFEIKLQVSVVGHVIFYVLQRLHQLLAFSPTQVDSCFALRVALHGNLGSPLKFKEGVDARGEPGVS